MIDNPNQAGGVPLPSSHHHHGAAISQVPAASSDNKSGLSCAWLERLIATQRVWGRLGSAHRIASSPASPKSSDDIGEEREGTCILR